MKFKFLSTQLNNIVKDAQLSVKDSGKEICGFLVDNGYFIEIIKLKNKTKKGGGYSFYLKEADFIEKACTIMNHKIVGTFHSHPYYIAVPGDSDKANAFDNELMLIIDVMGKDIKLWQITNTKEKEIPFELI
ncbi:MAG: Mov34/MPN/PAD-1 family protein [Acidobacteria bacterium]|nr:Mov34/MPN/PAD-1 family protein [Acidobacteriota bacterium]